jgi:hypothetical protein
MGVSVETKNFPEYWWYFDTSLFCLKTVSVFQSFKIFSHSFDRLLFLLEIVGLNPKHCHLLRLLETTSWDFTIVTLYGVTLKCAELLRYKSPTPPASNWRILVMSMSMLLPSKMSIAENINVELEENSSRSEKSSRVAANLLETTSTYLNSSRIFQPS